ncbi:hypothetical protein Acid345_1064 [Candidatus Koribacter versatilis Ellin345]|uniref:DUF4845 domain-containing protein n=1 Tax=Koribacter versatilis (strain Ellin345) TaxID=204669 RepID=Q1IST3_KORVE|nr:DUF4845 domain-containing protein [Candidatus Koribacter versatilis]ABF40067.1 hypothetical protein Acid345_1064 [Candidatus Koribacter versatilis Ellin345]
MSRIKAVFAFVIIIGVVYVCYVIGPPYFNNYQFQDDLNTEVRFMQNARKSDEEIKADIIKKATDNGIQLTPAQIRINLVGKTMTVEVNYSVHVELPGYSSDIQFHPVASNTLVM